LGEKSDAEQEEKKKGREKKKGEIKVGENEANWQVKHDYQVSPKEKDVVGGGGGKEYKKPQVKKNERFTIQVEVSGWKGKKPGERGKEMDH